MSYRTVEVELEHGQVRSANAEVLPLRAHALLTILDPTSSKLPNSLPASGAGLQRFLTQPDFLITPEQFRASMDTDFWDQ